MRFVFSRLKLINIKVLDEESNRCQIGYEEFLLVTCSGLNQVINTYIGLLTELSQ